MATRERRIIDLGRSICAHLNGDYLHKLDYLTTLTMIRSNEEPDRTEEFEQQLLEFILALAACQHTKRDRIESLISWHFIEESARRRKSGISELPAVISEYNWPLWKRKIKAFIKSRDYRHTWWDRLKTCIAMVTIIHLLACLFIPEIRDWTLDIIVRCNEEYFRSLADQKTPAPIGEALNDSIVFLIHKLNM